MNITSHWFADLDDPLVLTVIRRMLTYTGTTVADVDDSYRMTVIEKIKGLMDEVEVIHKKEEVQLQKKLVSLYLNTVGSCCDHFQCTIEQNRIE